MSRTVMSRAQQSVDSATSVEARAAARVYIARRDRTANPEGTFDKRQRWYPSDAEAQPCCGKIRYPSAAYPFSLMKHCRTVQHVASLCGVTPAALRRALYELEPASRPSGPPDRAGEYYKAVAVVDDAAAEAHGLVHGGALSPLRSIYDGSEYHLGLKRTQAVRTGHRGGFYVYPTVDAARNADVPQRSRLRDLPRAILRVRAEGQCSIYSNGKYCFSSITPIEVVED